MSDEATLHYFRQPSSQQAVRLPIEFVTVQHFTAAEKDCLCLWDMVATQFRTRSKFLMIWPHVRYLCLHRTAAGELDGFALVSTPLNWQIDYVVVHPQSRGQGIASALVQTALNEAHRAKTPYVMLTSRDGLRALYEGECGFRVVNPP